MVKNKNKLICVIVSCLLAVMVAISPLFIVNNNKFTANADSITGSEPIVVIPSFNVLKTSEPDKVFSVPSLYLTRINDNVYRLYYASSSSGTEGYYTSLTFIRNDPNSSVPIRLHGMYLNSSNTSYSTYSYSELFNRIGTDPSSYASFNLPSDYNLWSDIYSLSIVTNHVDNQGTVLNIWFNNSNRNKVGFIRIQYLPEFIHIDSEYYFNFVTVSNNISETDMNKYLYDSGYQSGYNSGYQNGYNKGVKTTWKDLSPWEALSNGINDLLNAELFGNVSLRTLLMCGMGVMLVLLLFKLVR